MKMQSQKHNFAKKQTLEKPQNKPNKVKHL